MIHPIKSIIARRQAFQYNNFETTKYAKELRKFKDIHKGESCFIIGNGPSLKIEDLDAIQKLGVPSFAFNRIFCVFDETKWRPTYYISQDENVTFGMKDKFAELNLPPEIDEFYFARYRHAAVLCHIILRRELPRSACR